jgi:hypothetical protein
LAANRTQVSVIFMLLAWGIVLGNEFLHPAALNFRKKRSGAD